jgi:hypothetical protein
MAINFPDSPSINEEFSAGERIWIWNGTVWKSKETAVLETGKYIVSDTAPENPQEGDAWFDSTRTKEFIYYDGFWVETSAAAVGLPAGGYATTEYVDTAVSNVQVDLTGYATETYVDNSISAIPPVDLTGYATETYVGTQISNLVDSAPAALDTLNELAAALGDDANFASTITTSLSNKSDVGHTHTISDIIDYVDPMFNLDGGKANTNFGGIIPINGGNSGSF